jgi:hypothetical protein
MCFDFPYMGMLQVRGKIITGLGEALGDLNDGWNAGFFDTALQRISRVSQDLQLEQPLLTTRGGQMDVERLLRATLVDGYCESASYSPAIVKQTARAIEREMLGDFSHYRVDAQVRDETLASVRRVMLGRRLFLTEHGGLAVCPTSSRAGDIICIIYGCSNPVVFAAGQSFGAAELHRVHGTCFLEDWMDPWSTNRVKWKEEDAQQFTLL